jgi:hypothetical protein
MVFMTGQLNNQEMRRTFIDLYKCQHDINDIIDIILGMGRYHFLPIYTTDIKSIPDIIITSKN